MSVLPQLECDLFEAASRRLATHGAEGSRSTGRRRRPWWLPLKAAVIAAVLGMAGGAIALAATGVLSGSQ